MAFHPPDRPDPGDPRAEHRRRAGRFLTDLSGLKMAIAEVHVGNVDRAAHETVVMFGYAAPEAIRARDLLTEAGQKMREAAGLIKEAEDQLTALHGRI